MRSDVSRTMFVAISLAINGQPVVALSSYAGHASRFGSVAAPRVARRAKRGGARRDRTDDLMLAKHALSQLSYGPVPEDECSLARRAEARINQPAFANATARQPSFKRACRAEAAEQPKAGGPGKT